MADRVSEEGVTPEVALRRALIALLAQHPYPTAKQLGRLGISARWVDAIRNDLANRVGTYDYIGISEHYARKITEGEA